MRTIDELIAGIPAFVQKLRDGNEWYPVQERDIGESGLGIPCYLNIDRFCFGGEDCNWNEVSDRFYDIEEAACAVGAHFMQSDGDYRNYYMYITKPMTSDEISGYLAALEGPRAEGIRRHVAEALRGLSPEQDKALSEITRLSQEMGLYD